MALIGVQLPRGVKRMIRRCTEADLDAATQERLEARGNKDFARADQIRDELVQKGIELLDSPAGTTWKIK